MMSGYLIQNLYIIELWMNKSLYPFIDFGRHNAEFHQSSMVLWMTYVHSHPKNKSTGETQYYGDSS